MSGKEEVNNESESDGSDGNASSSGTETEEEEEEEKEASASASESRDLRSPSNIKDQMEKPDVGSDDDGSDDGWESLQEQIDHLISLDFLRCDPVQIYCVVYFFFGNL